MTKHWICMIAVLLTGTALFAVPRRLRAAASAARPNILVVFTDDQGYGDLSCYGSTTIRTPRIDQLARAGTRGHAVYELLCPNRMRSITLGITYWPLPGTQPWLKHCRYPLPRTTSAFEDRNANRDLVSMSGYANGSVPASDRGSIA